MLSRPMVILLPRKGLTGASPRGSVRCADEVRFAAGETQSYSKVIDFDDGRMILLPSGCWVIAPRVLTKKDGTPVGRLSLLDALSPATWATGDSDLDDVPNDGHCPARKRCLRWSA